MMNAPFINYETPKSSEQIKIKQDNDTYNLKLEIFENSITFVIHENESIIYEYYTKTMELNEIKKIDRVFYGLNTCGEFLDYIKASINQNKLRIKKLFNDKISINITVEYLLKEHNIEIFLGKKAIKIEDSIKNIYKEFLDLKDKYKNFEENLDKKIQNAINAQNETNMALKQENQKLKEENEIIKQKIEMQNNEINKIKEEINKKINIAQEINENKENKEIKPFEKINKMIIENSCIIQENEFEIIYKALKERINREIKEIKKLYQATVDGGNPKKFHEKCDNINNTLVLIKSEGKRRFGGFTSVDWTPQSIFDKEDKNAFLFSLDKKKIYPYKNKNRTISCYSNKGPIFGYNSESYIIRIEGNPIYDKKLYTNESCNDCNFDFQGDKNALSEDGKKKYIYAEDYEVFQIIFI